MASNLQTLKDLYAAFGRGDVPAVLDTMTPDIEWCEPASIPYGSQVGPQAVAENIFARVVQDVAGFTVVPQEFVDGGDVIVSLGRYQGKGAGSGVAFDLPFAHVWRFRNGKISYFRTHTDTKLWLDAVAS
jgi:uncharacterized protein